MVASKLGRNYQGYEVSKKTYDRCMSILKVQGITQTFNCDGTEMLYTRNETADLVLVLRIIILKNTKLQKIN